MLINILLVCFCIFLFDFTGFVTLKYLKWGQASYTSVIGFLVFFGFFELIGIVPMFFHQQFNQFLLFFFILLAIVYGLLIAKNLKIYINDLNMRLHNRYYLVITIVAFMCAAIIGYLAIGMGDSWLFSPMILSTITNNQIFAHNGTLLNGEIQSFHFLDGYYLFQAILAKIGVGNDFTFITTFPKAIEAFIIIQTIGMIVNYFIDKNKNLIFLVVTLCLMIGVPIFTNYPQYNEIEIHLFKSMSLGISIINNVCSIVLVLLLLDKSLLPIKRAILVPILILAMFAFSSSALFICFAILIVIMLVYLLGNWEKTNLLSIIIGFIMIAMVGCFYALSKSLIFAIICFIGSFVIIGLLYVLYRYLNVNQLKQVGTYGLVGFLVVNFICILVTNDTQQIINDIISLNDDDLYYSGVLVYYKNFFANIFIMLFFATGCIYIYKHEKNFSLYIILMLLIFANPVSYRTIGNMIDLAVYHRVFFLFFPGMINILGFGALLNYLDEKISFDNTKYLYGFLLPLFLFFPNNNIPLNLITSDYDAYKTQNVDAVELAKFDFSQTKNVVLPILPNPTPKLAPAIDDLIKIRGDLNWVNCNNPDGFYIIVHKNQDIENVPIVYASENYKIYYSPEGEGCQIDKN